MALPGCTAVGASWRPVRPGRFRQSEWVAGSEAAEAMVPEDRRVPCSQRRLSRPFHRHLMQAAQQLAAEQHLLLQLLPRRKAAVEPQLPAGEHLLLQLLPRQKAVVDEVEGEQQLMQQLLRPRHPLGLGGDVAAAAAAAGRLRQLQRHPRLRARRCLSRSRRRRLQGRHLAAALQTKAETTNCIFFTGVWKCQQ